MVVMQQVFRMGIAAWVLLGFGAVASAQDKAAIEAGEALYDEHCASCHGEKLRSTGAMPDLRKFKADERSRFDQVVSEGRGQMPAWGGLINEPELNQLWAYIRSRAG